MSETPTNVTPPPDLTYGYVDGRIILAIGDRSDAGRMPDPVPADDTTVTFTPANTILKVASPTPATVIKQPIVCSVDANGYLVDGQGARGVWLVTGTYKVTYSHSRAIIPSHDIEVTTGHTEVAPLDLTTAMPPGGPVLAPSEYAELNGRLTILEAGGGGGGVTGTGSPEGVVTAPVGTYYTDTAITNGALRWAKKSGTGNTGWVCVEGDTGLRDLSSFINAPATAVTFQACRSGRVTYLTILVSFSSTAWTPGNVLFTLPDGFRPAAPYYVSPPYAGPGALSVEPSGSAALWSSNVSTVTAWSFAYVTPAAWPSTLPGVAV